MGEQNKSNISRRSFLAGLGATGALAATGMIAGCAQADSGTAKADAETADDASASTGDTEANSSMQAGSWRDKPAELSIDETIDVDVVVVGAGNGGLVAATTAAQEGAKVLVLEKRVIIADAREAIGALNSPLEPDHIEDVPTLINHADMVNAGDTNGLLYKTWAEKSGEMIAWMKETLEPKDMLFPFEWHAPQGGYYPAMCYNPCLGEYNPDGPNYGAYAHLAMMQETFTELGGEIMFESPAQYLVQDSDGKVTGVVAISEEKGNIQVNASRAVIICTGGYAANLDMVEEFAPVALNGCALSSAGGEEGDGIRMVLNAGGYLEEGGACMIWNRAIVDVDTELGFPWQGDIFLPGSQPFLHVNANGERFMNEDQCYPMSFAGGLQQPGRFSWTVWDESYWDDIAQFDTCGCSRLYPAPSGTAFNADVYDCEALTKEHLDSFWLEPRLESGLLKKCDTLDELAEAMGFDTEQAETFKSTVARYNEIAAAGNDTDFGKADYRLSTLDQPPYYAAKIAGALLCSIHGVITNTNSQPLREDGSVIEGLYVCGNDQGGFYPHNYPSNFTGINAGRTATFGRIAAKHALGIA